MRDVKTYTKVQYNSCYVAIHNRNESLNHSSKICNKRRKENLFEHRIVRITLTLTIFVMQNIFKKISLRLSRIIVLNKRRRKLYIFGRKTVRFLPEFDAPIYVSISWQKVLNSRKRKANNSYMNCVRRYGNEYVQLQRLFGKSLVKKSKT